MWIGVKNCNNFCFCLALSYFEGRDKPDESRVALLFDRKSYPIVELILKNSEMLRYAIRRNYMHITSCNLRSIIIPYLQSIYTFSYYSLSFGLIS